jgi:N-acyl-phosphatidylethanolamine-hydrolysing phospholipase D
LPVEREEGGFLRWQWERLRQGRPPDPPAGALPVVPHAAATPRAAPDELRVTWVGHATFLIQAGGLNLLTDPHWSRRASPSQRLGPSRFQPPGIPFEELPPVDAVLLSHDHYDHLDLGTVRRLAEAHPQARWFTPLGYRAWMRDAGVGAPSELDWWDQATLEAPGGTARVICLPAQHWTRRRLSGSNTRLWASYALLTAAGKRVYFGGDSGYFPGYREIGERVGPFDLSLLPVGAYDPRWFMAPAHMNPEEAVQAYLDLGGQGDFAAMHWGTFRLTDEDPLEPPVRLRAAWQAQGLAEESLHLFQHGETRLI